MNLRNPRFSAYFCAENQKVKINYGNKTKHTT